MRVAHITDCYLPRTGGIELQVRGLAHAQLAAGLEPFVVTATPANERQASIPGELDEGVPVHRLSVRLPSQLPVSPYVNGRLRELLIAQRADVVHVHGGSISPFAWPALRTAVKAGFPAVVTVHSVWAQWAGLFGAVNSISGWRKWSVQWTAVSDVAAKDLRRALGGSVPVAVLPNGIDLSRWRPDGNDNWSPPGDGTEAAKDRPFTVVSVARFAPRKRMRPLVDILEDARAAVPQSIPMRAVLIGDGPDRNRVQRILQRQQMTWVECVGWRNHDQIRSLYNRADAFIAPARYESFGIAALEARTFGLPVVTLTESGTASFIGNGREGLLAADDSGLARALAELATQPEMLSRIRNHNRNTEPAFGWPHVVRLTEDIYEAALGTPPGARNE